MKKSLTRIFVSLVMLLFVNFMFSNAIFTHVHKGIDGRPVTHSHPYLPSGTHGHTAHSLDLISAFNAASIAAAAVHEISVPDPEVFSSLIYVDVTTFAVVNHIPAYSLRGPPALCA